MIHLVSGAVDDDSEVSALAEEVCGNITWLGVLLQLARKKVASNMLGTPHDS